MSLSRMLLLRASRSQSLAELFRRQAFARRAVRRFMPGEDLGAALDAAASFSSTRIGSVVTALGERVRSREEADRVREHYLTVMDAIRARGLPAHVSVKLTNLGLDVDRDECAASLRLLAARAEQTGSFLWIDMEESHYVDATLELYRRTRAHHQRVGVCLQAYLRRTPADLESLLPLAPAIRLVKGAYHEEPDVAYAKKADTDAAFLRLADTLLENAGEGRGLPVFGTHDLGLLARIRERAAARHVPRGGYEVHMLYGIKATAQRALASQGVSIRVLVSYGTQWFPWYMRRLAERPANVWFVVRSLVSWAG